MAQWLPDGSSGFTVDGNTVTHTDVSGGGNIYNCLWNEGDGVSSGSHYWKIHFDSLEDGGGVGITSKDLFKEGFACRALSYCGNLTSGIGLLVNNFGAPPCAGDTVGIYASFEDDRLKVYIDINGKSLGLAFDVPSSTFKSVFPIVFFNTSGSANCHKEHDPPSSTVRLCTAFTGIEGDWKFKGLIQENEGPLDVLPELHATLATKLRKDGENEYVWFTNVVNNINTRLWFEDGKWKTSHTQSTKMLGAPEHMEVEGKINDLINALTSINIDDDGNLSAKSDTLSSVWTRYDATPGPFVGEPF